MEIETKLYKGKIKVKFLGPTPESPSRHMYYVDGVRKTGVTSALDVKDKSRALMIWQSEEIAKRLFDLLEKKEELTTQKIITAVFEAETIKNRAAELGTIVHEWIEKYINHKLSRKHAMPEMPEDADVVTGVTSFLEWEAKHKVKYLWSEKVVYSKKYDYIGKADFGAIVDGKICLCDIKTGNSIYNSVLAQTAAYLFADHEESGMNYEGRWVIRIAKETREQYEARMDLKNKTKMLLGKNGNDVAPYQVFEALFLDGKKTNMKRDFKAFLSHWDLLMWDRETNLYNASKK